MRDHSAEDDFKGKLMNPIPTDIRANPTQSVHESTSCNRTTEARVPNTGAYSRQLDVDIGPTIWDSRRSHKNLDPYHNLEEYEI